MSATVQNAEDIMVSKGRHSSYSLRTYSLVGGWGAGGGENRE